jgi:AP-3 complex subunit mu
MPDVLVTMNDPTILSNAGLHPCIRIQKFSRDKLLSFIPPDGEFTLLDYWYNFEYLLITVFM